MGIKEIIQRLRGEEQEEDELPDDETRDKYLRSLRRERRTQMEEVEKEQLQKDIKSFQQEKMKRHLFGIKGEIKKRGIIQEQVNKKKVNVLANGKPLLNENSLLNNKKNEFKKTKSAKTGMLKKWNL